MKIYFSNWKVRPPPGNIILKKLLLTSQFKNTLFILAMCEKVLKLHQGQV